MTWTHEPPNDIPTGGAWFWCRRKRGDLWPFIVRCYRHYKGYTAISMHPMDERDVKTLDYEWAGPIPEPMESKTVTSIHDYDYFDDYFD